MRFEARPLTPETWSDLEALFALPGGSIVRGCWCMYYRTTGPVSVSAAAGVEHKAQLCDLVESGVRPGLVGYADGRPAGWISLGPREDYLKLRRSRVMKPVDDAEVWSIVCTYVAKEFRGQGLQHRLLAAALDFARDNGVRLRRGLPGRQARAQPRRLHVLRLPEPLRAGRLHRGRAPLAHPRRDAPPAPAEEVTPRIRGAAVAIPCNAKTPR